MDINRLRVISPANSPSTGSRIPLIPGGSGGSDGSAMGNTGAATGSMAIAGSSKFSKQYLYVYT